MQLPRASTSALADGYCPAIVAESLASVSAVDAVACCAVVGRAGNPAAMKSEIPIAAIKGRALLIAPPPPFSPYRLLIAELGQRRKSVHPLFCEVPRFSRGAVRRQISPVDPYDTSTEPL